MRHKILAILLLFTSTAAQAVQYYHLELIAFEHLDTVKKWYADQAAVPTADLANEQTNAKLTNQEYFAHNKARIDFTKAKLLTEFKQDLTDQVSEPVILLSESSYKLTGEEKKITLSRNFKLIHHVAWRQSFAAKAIPIQVRGGKFMVDLEAAGLTEPELNIYDEHYITQHAKIWELNGVLAVTPLKAPYLRVKAEFMFNPMGKSGAIQERLPTNSFYLIQQARVRQNELYYFDHPLFGVIVLISPIADK